MKKRGKNILFCLLGIGIFLISISLFSFKDVYALEKNVSITKTESNHYYTYEIKDYERGLEYSWQFIKDKAKKVSVEDSLYIDEDLRLSLNKTSEGALRIEDKVDQKKLIVSFDYHGTLPLKTMVTLNVQNEFKNGKELYLYYYNPDNDTIEYITKNVEVKNGKVSFEIEHCSDYFLTGAVVNDAVNNPQSVNYIIIGLIAVVIVLVAVTLIQSKK